MSDTMQATIRLFHAIAAPAHSSHEVQTSRAVSMRLLLNRHVGVCNVYAPHRLFARDCSNCERNLGDIIGFFVPTAIYVHPRMICTVHMTIHSDMSDWHTAVPRCCI
jgi:hypothetical protein